MSYGRSSFGVTGFGDAVEEVSASSSVTITSTADDAVFSGSASVSPLSAIAATAADATFSGSASSSPASPTAAIAATSDDAVFSGSASAVAAGSFTTKAKARNNAGSLEASVAVTWSWNYGSVGAETGRVTGSGSTSSNGYFTASGLAAGAGYLLMKTAGGAVYYEEGTVS